MFRRNRKLVDGWDQLEDALIGNFDAEPASRAELRMHVHWKGAGSQEIRVSRAPVPGLGLVVYICAPICQDADSASCRKAMASAADFLLGAVAIEGGALVLRTSVPFAAMPLADVKWLVEQTALGARTVREELEAA